MKSAAASPGETLLLVPFKEVRHFQPDDCVHYEPVTVRAREMNWKIPAHRHEALHQFQFIAEGRVEGSIDGRAFEVRGPALLALAPGSVHGFTYTPDIVGHQVTVPAGTMRQLLGGTHLAQSDLGSSCVLLPSGDAHERAGFAATFAALFAGIAEEFRNQSPARVHALLAHTTLLAVQVLRRRGDAEEDAQRRGARDTLVQRYQAALEQHFRAQHALPFYAHALHVTPDHLSRTCRNVCGLSAQQLLHDRLMLEARRLLAYTGMPVADVAEHLGYADAAYFSKFFGRSVGETPSQYRALVAQGVMSAATSP